jgi:hypothetical protein
VCEDASVSLGYDENKRSIMNDPRNNNAKPNALLAGEENSVAITI